MTDERRPDSLGCYGSSWAHTPNPDGLAAEGVLVQAADAPSPARTSLLTGNIPSGTGVFHHQQRLPARARMLTWAFEEAGYQTASFAKKHHFLPCKRQAFQVEVGRVTDEFVSAAAFHADYDPATYDVLQYPDLPAREIRRRWVLGGKFPAPRDRTAEAENVSLALSWLDKRDRYRPFFLRLSLNAPHTPVVVPPEFLSLVDPERISLLLPRAQDLADKPARERVHLQDFQGALCLSADQIRKLQHYYYARAAFLDAESGRLLTWMRRRDLLSNTIVVFVSDHGTHLGDPALLQKQTFYELGVTVPWLLWWRGWSSRGRRHTSPVSTNGILSTLAALAGVRTGWRCEAEPLMDAGGRLSAAGAVFSEIKFGYPGYQDDDRQVMVRSGRWKLSQFLDGDPDGAPYDLEEDLEEKINLYARRPRVAAQLAVMIHSWELSRCKAT